MLAYFSSLSMSLENFVGSSVGEGGLTQYCAFTRQLHLGFKTFVEAHHHFNHATLNSMLIQRQFADSSVEGEMRDLSRVFGHMFDVWTEYTEVLADNICTDGLTKGLGVKLSKIVLQERRLASMAETNKRRLTWVFLSLLGLIDQSNSRAGKHFLRHILSRMEGATDESEPAELLKRLDVDAAAFPEVFRKAVPSSEWIDFGGTEENVLNVLSLALERVCPQGISDMSCEPLVIPFVGSVRLARAVHHLIKNIGGYFEGLSRIRSAANPDFAQIVAHFKICDVESHAAHLLQTQEHISSQYSLYLRDALLEDEVVESVKDNSRETMSAVQNYLLNFLVRVCRPMPSECRYILTRVETTLLLENILLSKSELDAFQNRKNRKPTVMERIDLMHYSKNEVVFKIADELKKIVTRSVTGAITNIVFPRTLEHTRVLFKQGYVSLLNTAELFGHTGIWVCHMCAAEAVSSVKFVNGQPLSAIHAEGFPLSSTDLYYTRAPFSPEGSFVNDIQFFRFENQQQEALDLYERVWIDAGYRYEGTIIRSTHDLEGTTVYSGYMLFYQVGGSMFSDHQGMFDEALTPFAARPFVRQLSNVVQAVEVKRVSDPMMASVFGMSEMYKLFQPQADGTFEIVATVPFYAWEHEDDEDTTSSFDGYVSYPVKSLLADDIKDTAVVVDVQVVKNSMQIDLFKSLGYKEIPLDSAVLDLHGYTLMFLFDNRELGPVESKLNIVSTKNTAALELSYSATDLLQHDPSLAKKIDFLMSRSAFLRSSQVSFLQQSICASKDGGCYFRGDIMENAIDRADWWKGRDSDHCDLKTLQNLAGWFDSDIKAVLPDQKGFQDNRARRVEIVEQKAVRLLESAKERGIGVPPSDPRLQLLLKDVNEIFNSGCDVRFMLPILADTSTCKWSRVIVNMEVGLDADCYDERRDAAPQLDESLLQGEDDLQDTNEFVHMKYLEYIWIEVSLARREERFDTDFDSVTVNTGFYRLPQRFTYSHPDGAWGVGEDERVLTLSVWVKPYRRVQAMNRPEACGVRLFSIASGVVRRNSVVNLEDSQALPVSQRLWKAALRSTKAQDDDYDQLVVPPAHSLRALSRLDSVAELS
eukprot:GILJ01001799.1.p1 GENE.GILJ01001799.1~~GILJ01001799.1.p1  ORF type:complete len:1176 (+),score=175.25 GILJ01001799.1:234-3530(+)